MKRVALICLFVVASFITFSWTVFLSKGFISVSANATPIVADPTEEESWIWLDLPPDATQLDHGKEVYRLVCSPCHAYDGTGLTDEWRSTWNPEDQNCWQSKCHATNHPPDGFFLPYSPPIVGAIIPAMFETAYDLYLYNHEEMPWHNVHSLTEKESWAVTAYVLELNGFDPGSRLDAETAVNLRLRPVESAPVENPEKADEFAPDLNRDRGTETISEPRYPDRRWLLMGGIGAALLGVLLMVVLLLWRNRRTR